MTITIFLAADASPGFEGTPVTILGRDFAYVLDKPAKLVRGAWSAVYPIAKEDTEDEEELTFLIREAVVGAGFRR